VLYSVWVNHGTPCSAATSHQQLWCASASKTVLATPACCPLQADATLDAAREVDALRGRLTVLEADSEGMRAALRDIQARHVEQVAR
jgi:hypothetical protein